MALGEAARRDLRDRGKSSVAALSTNSADMTDCDLVPAFHRNRPQEDPTKRPQPNQAPNPDLVANGNIGSDNVSASSVHSNQMARSPTSRVPSNMISAQKLHERLEDHTISSLQTFIVVLAICLSVFLAALDVTIVTTALPTIAEAFHSSAGYTWIGSAFLLGQAASTASWGKISDIFGRKPALMGAIGTFFIGSLICGVSQNIRTLIVGRSIQGLAAGALLVLDNIIIADLFSLRERGKYYGFVGSTWAIAGGMGPVLGGLFAEKASWRWCFYINLPISGLVFVMVSFALRLQTPKTPLRAGLLAIDWYGTVAMVGSVVMFLLGLQLGGTTYPWKSGTVVCLIIFGLVAAVIFFLIEWKVARYPIMPLQIFHKLSNVAALMACLFHGFGFIAAAFYLPLYFQIVLGAAPLLSGVYFLSLALAMSLSAAVTGIYIEKTGRYIECIILGFFFMTLGLGLFINLPINHQWVKIIIYSILVGLGSGPNFQSPLVALQTGVPDEDIATATATFNFVRNIATSVAVVIGSVVFSNTLANQGAHFRQHLGDEVADLLTGGNAEANVFILDKLPAAQKAFVRALLLKSLQKTWILFTCLAAAGLVTSFFVRRRTLSIQNVEVELGLVGEEIKREAKKVAT